MPPQQLPTRRLSRSFSRLEDFGFSLNGLLVWPGTVIGMHVALGPQAIWVWLPAVLVAMLLNLQLARLGTARPDIAGGTPNYATQLLQKYPHFVLYAGIAAIVFIFRGIFQYGQDTLMAKASLKVVFDMRVGVYGHLQKLSLNYFQDAKTGDLSYRLTEDIERIGEVIKKFFQQFLPSVLQLIIVLGYIIYLNWQAVEVIASIPDRKTTGLLFPSVRQPNKPMKLSMYWPDIRNRAALPDVRLHDLRHSFASTAIRDNTSLMVIGKLLGHALAETTSRYTHLSDEVIADAAERVSGSIASLIGVSQ